MRGHSPGCIIVMLIDRFGKRDCVLMFVPVFVLVPGLVLVTAVGVVAAADNTALSAAFSFSTTASTTALFALLVG